MTQARATCAGLAEVRVRHLAQDGDQSLARSMLSGREQRVGGPDAVSPAIVPVVPARQQPLGQRAVGDHRLWAVGLRERSRSRFWRAVDEVCSEPGC